MFLYIKIMLFYITTLTLIPGGGFYGIPKQGCCKGALKALGGLPANQNPDAFD